MKTICVDTARRLITSVKEEFSSQKLMLKAVIPTALCSFVCISLSNCASTIPPSQVVWATTKALNILAGLFVVKGAQNIFAALDEERATLQGRKIEKIEISEVELLAMQAEIARLKEEVLQLKAKGAIVERVLLPQQKRAVQLSLSERITPISNPQDIHRQSIHFNMQ